jgi:hypothetical protein
MAAAPVDADTVQPWLIVETYVGFFLHFVLWSAIFLIFCCVPRSIGDALLEEIVNDVAAECSLTLDRLAETLAADSAPARAE